MLIQFKKDSEGNFILNCIRKDSTSTWQKYRQSFFQVEHDLIHYVVETVLGYKNAFYGILASGKDISWFATPDPALGVHKKPIVSEEASYAEIIVGQIQALRNDDEFFKMLPLVFEKFGLAMPSITKENLKHIRLTVNKYLDDWHKSKEGISLEFTE